MKQLTQEQLEQVYREHPEWRTSLEVGKWYKYPDIENFKICITEILNDSVRGFGFQAENAWMVDGHWEYLDDCLDEVVECHMHEVAEALIAEARRRGFKAGVEINNSSLGFRDNWQKIEGDDIEWEGGHLNFGKKGTSIFHDGKWATVITPENDISADIQALKDKYPNYNWTIIAEEKQ